MMTFSAMQRGHARRHYLMSLLSRAEYDYAIGVPIERRQNTMAPKRGATSILGELLPKWHIILIAILSAIKSSIILLPAHEARAFGHRV